MVKQFLKSDMDFSKSSKKYFHYASSLMTYMYMLRSGKVNPHAEKGC